MKTALGLMSGTSMDGIDVALVRTDGLNAIEFGPTLAVPYSPTVRRAIEQGLVDGQAIVDRRERPGTLRELEKALTHIHAEVVNQFLRENKLDADNIDCLGFHGQTILHRPDQALTVQLGDGEGLTSATGIDVVYDMRAADMVAGGQGAPLVPVFHRALAQSVESEPPICFVNIGGISNITYIDGEDLIAFDTGPGNALIDQWVQAKGGIPFDQGGRIASEGQVVQSIADRYLNANFFAKPGPKSLDRNDFPALDPAEVELSDGARTLAYITAASIMRSLEHLPRPPRTWMICGGGRLNDIIMADLTSFGKAHGARVVACEEAGLQGDMLEAQAFAYLAVRSAKGLPLTFPGTTGCNEPTTGGVLKQVPALPF